MEIFLKGGIIAYFILLSSVFMVFLFVKKVIQLHRAQINTEEFLSGLRNELIAKRITEAVDICEGTPGPVASVLKAGITHQGEGKAGFESAMGKVGSMEIARMENGVSPLATIGIVTPLLGLLGTILGLMDIFQKMSDQGGLLNVADFASGLWQALITTAFGLAVSVPSYIAYNYLVGRIHKIIRDIEIGSAELIEILSAE